MSITEISVKRPAAITMVIVFLFGLGIFGYKSLGVDLLPAMNVPVITISCSYAGAGSDDIKTQIVEPIENALSGISGIDTMSSRSRMGSGTVVLRFTAATDMNSALMDVQRAVDIAGKSLPTAATKPTIYKVDTNGQAVLTLALQGNNSYEELYNAACNIQTEVENLPGVAQVTLQGVDQRELFVKLNKTAIEYYGINLNTLMTQLQSDNINMPAGSIIQDKLNEPVTVSGDFTNVDEIKNLVIPTANNGNIRLADIADVKLDYPVATAEARLNGKTTLGILIQQQSDANEVEVVNTVKGDIPKISKTLPAGMKLVVANDQSVFINQSISQVKEHLIEGIITTSIVLYLFLKSWRSSLVVLVAIPTSLISTFFMMHVLNFTLNMMSLMGLSLCIGALVDDSIVVLENIQRHLKMGKNPIIAAIEGRKEIGMAAIAITLCDVVVYLPIALMPGSMVQQMFYQFAMTVVFATVFSLFVSFTVTPMLASRFFTNKELGKKGILEKYKDNGFFKTISKFTNFMEIITNFYRKVLIWSFRHRIKVLVSIILCVVLSIALVPLNIVKTEYMPATDQGNITLSLSLTPGSTLQETDAKTVQVEKYLKTIPEVTQYFTNVGNGSDVTSSQINLQLVDKAKRKKSQSDIATELRNWGRKNITGANFMVNEASQMGGFGGGSSNPISVNITGPDDDVLKSLSYEIEDMINSVPGVIGTSNTARSSQAEFKVSINRLAASQYNVSVSDIATAISTAISGTQAGTYQPGESATDQYNVMVQFMDGQIKTAADIASIKILNSSGQQISVGQVASIQQADAPKQINRLNRQDTFTISGNLRPGAALGDVTQQIQAKLNAATFPTGYKIVYGGSQKQMSDSTGPLVLALLVSLALVYMILVVLYESFVTPALRLISLPCAVIGALGILALTGKTLNLMSVIGLIMLDGMASKNGTLLIDYTNTLMKRGMNLKEALLESGTTRLQPIIMTTMTMIVGMMPAALAMTEGSETQSAMACVIIGGMIASTVLSPIIIPVVYTLIDDCQIWVSKMRNNASHNSEVERYEG